MVVATYELRVDATGLEGSLTVTLGCGSEAAARESNGVQRRVAEAYRQVFEADDEPIVLARVTRVLPTAVAAA